MAKARINKFIFNDGKVFLRIKAVANGLKILRSDDSYKILFTIKGGKVIEIPLVYKESFQAPEAIYDDALTLGFDESEVQTFKNSLVKMTYGWGELVCFNAASESSEYFYLIPQDQSIAVRIGPIPNNIDDQQFEIDWTNIQWGSQ